ncbi:hypothetical protein HRI_004820600 [Hibiscus trionum]|uniref:Aminotransferase-like plant mobile domain-containing protein n=1 Tax=Hibiscus trionum TaxID=183268 RepID=A0A9W7MQW1_HIBTR|nr:hypothetical protein HRI_004820600 [Hibiscus trionum]
MVEPAGNEDEAIVEERQELMVSLFANGKPHLRSGHFLKPTPSSIDEQIPELFPLSFSSLPYSFQPKEWPLNVRFSGWVNPKEAWVFWVDIMRPMYQQVWEKAGIFEAIMNSTCLIKRYTDLVFGLAEKWSPETNTFIFPWGETTITLEDVLVLGGYSVVGFPVTFSGDSQELKEAEDKLVAEYRKIRRGTARRISLKEWMDYFIGSGRDIEHEAFLSMWLTRFVFQDNDAVIRPRLFPIACLLARGKVVALGPAVLASIYKDLTLLKETIVGSTRFNGDEFDDCVTRIRVFSPMKLVQLWAWERFPALQPQPQVIQDLETRLARWSDTEIVKVENVRMILDSAGETFDWRPYVKVVNNKQSHGFYKEKEGWILIDGNSSKELVSFALCLRPSELVGLGCIQQYLPHRVAMQFGIDQDVPAHVARSNESPEIAWKNYMRPINGRKLYIPSRFFESDVTVRYSEWWKKMEMVVRQDAIKGIVQRQRSSRKRPKQIPWVKTRKGENEASIPPGFTAKFITVKPEPFVDELEPEALEVSNQKAGVAARPFGHDNCSLAKAQGSLKARKGENEASIPPGFAAKFITVKPEPFVDELEPEALEVSNQKTSVATRPFGHDNCSPAKAQVSLKARKGENEASIPPGFPAKFITVKPEPSVNELEPEALEVSNQKVSVTTRPFGHDNCSLAKAQRLSSSGADNGRSEKMKVSMTPAQILEDRNEGSERVKNEFEFSLYSKDNTSKNGESSTFMEVNRIATRLEARVSRIERIVSELKAAQKLGRNPTKAQLQKTLP